MFITTKAEFVWNGKEYVEVFTEGYHYTGVISEAQHEFKYNDPGGSSGGSSGESSSEEVSTIDLSGFTLQDLINLGYEYRQDNVEIDDEQSTVDIWTLYDPEGNQIWRDDNYNVESPPEDIIFSQISTHINDNGFWNGTTYLSWDDYSDTDIQDIYDTALNQSETNEEFGGFETTGFDYSAVLEPTEYYGTETSFKQYLDNEFGSGAGGHINAALLAAGSPSEQLEILGYKGEPGQINLSGLGQIYDGIAKENIKKAMFQGILDASLTEPLSEDDIEFFSELGAPEFMSRLNLIEQQKTAQETSLLDTLTRTEADIERAQETTSQEFEDLPERLREPLLDADIGIAQAGASGLGYGGAVEGRESLSQEAQADYDMTSQELQRRLEELDIAGTRASEDYYTALDDISRTYTGTLLDIKGGISAETSQAQSEVERYVQSILTTSGAHTSELTGTEGEDSGLREGGQKKTVGLFRGW